MRKHQSFHFMGYYGLRYGAIKNPNPGDERRKQRFVFDQCSRMEAIQPFDSAEIEVTGLIPVHRPGVELVALKTVPLCKHPDLQRLPGLGR